jgi:D-arabinose 1-dehydrogenase-like Zn-dependent alcohol dehydrogenase
MIKPQLRPVIFVCGLLTVFGAVGALDVDPQASMLVSGALALAGLALMLISLPKQEG